MGEKLQQLDNVPDPKVTGLQDRLKDLTQSREWEIAQGAVDAAGIVDPTPISDGISAVMSVAKGDWIGAGLSAVSMIPYLGDAVAKTAKGARALKKLEALASEIKSTMKALEDAVAKRRIANRKAAAEEVRAARKEAANACAKCSAEQKYGTQLPSRGTWNPPDSPGNGTWTSDPVAGGGRYTVDYKDGYPDFTTAKGPDGKLIPMDKVELPDMTGKSTDFRAARDAMREKTGDPGWPGTDGYAPPDKVWHHKEDGVTMELLPKELHDRSMSRGGSGAAHTGGASIVKDKAF